MLEQILKTAGLISLKVNRALDPLTYSQYSILLLVEKEQKPMLQVAAELNTPVPGITGLVDRLEKEGYVERIRDSKDRRKVFCRITDKGKKSLSECKVAVKKIDSAINNKSLEQIAEKLLQEFESEK